MSDCYDLSLTFNKIFCAIALALAFGSNGPAQPPAKHSLTLEDVFATSRIERATLSPDGNWVAVVVQRPAKAGEVFGRTLYEMDPSRDDIWVVSTQSGEKRNITNGASGAAGFWCATWSPDGKRLAMLSTMPEGSEPRGGDNVRLYLWSQATNRLIRISDAPIMTQTLGGSPMYRSELRGGADRGDATHLCSDQENAPFLWLDNKRLLAVTLPEGQRSALLDVPSRPAREEARSMELLAGGIKPTMSAVAAGEARDGAGNARNSAIVQILDADEAGQASTVTAIVPVFPFRGDLTAAVSPDGRQAAIMATLSRIEPSAGRQIQGSDDQSGVAKALGILSLVPAGRVRWAELPKEAQFPLRFTGWKDSDTAGFQARADPYGDEATPFALSARSLAVRPGRAAALAKDTITVHPPSLPPNAEILETRPERKAALWRVPTPSGLYLQLTTDGGHSRELMSLDGHLANVEWGQTQLIPYPGANGQPLNAAVILPPDFQKTMRYPTIAWVYPGYKVGKLVGDYWLDPYLPGFYNLQLYAARGYIVVIPSIPLDRSKTRNEIYDQIPSSVLPALDKLVELGIADPDRIGVMGQSFGGYGVYALLTQTNRFRAGVAIAGISDLDAFYGEFGATARGYEGIEHEQSNNRWIAERGQMRLGVPPSDDPPLYARNSPLTFAGKIKTPLLLMHGQYDIRGNLSQAERMFSSLDRDGKTARLVRFWGEGHCICHSPANVRAVFEESVAWFDQYLAPRSKPSN